ncbi:MAG: LytTR family transcriptional regulator [Bacteroidales bacterium]|nr:LytTR family transcriptional regulator [Bacteroidales bacterium]
MAKLSKQTFSVKNNIIFVIFVTVFAILFAVLYAPTYGYDTSFWHEHDELFIPILAAIVLVTLVLSRTIMFFVARHSMLSKSEFLVWNMLEWLISCLFCDLFMCLYMHKGYFEILLPVLMIGFSVAIFPYAIAWLQITIMESNASLLDTQQTLEKLRRGISQVDEVVQFFDEKNTAKLLVDLNTVYSVESAGNYVNIVYEDNEKIQRFSLRNSMKGVEEVCEKHGLVRCHRSYYINLRKVKLIRKDSTGSYAVLQRPGLSDIPISKPYAAQVAQLFSTLM